MQIFLTVLMIVLNIFSVYLGAVSYTHLSGCD